MFKAVDGGDDDGEDIPCTGGSGISSSSSRSWSHTAVMIVIGRRRENIVKHVVAAVEMIV